MTSKDNNNDIIVTENHNNIIVRKIIGATECGTWNIFITKILVKTMYRPSDPYYFNKY